MSHTLPLDQKKKFIGSKLAISEETSRPMKISFLQLIGVEGGLLKKKMTRFNSILMAGLFVGDVLRWFCNDNRQLVKGQRLGINA
jgi:hypothetical protein